MENGSGVAADQCSKGGDVSYPISFERYQVSTDLSILVMSVPKVAGLGLIVHLVSREGLRSQNNTCCVTYLVAV